MDAFVGVAAVIDVRGSLEITLDHFDDIDFTYVSRVLIKTGAWLDQSVFPETFPVLANGVPAYLGQHGVKLVGVDVPSVDKYPSILANANDLSLLLFFLHCNHFFPGCLLNL